MMVVKFLISIAVASFVLSGVGQAADGKITHQPPDLARIAENVGLPGRQNCGACHFFGGGSDNVKHGDLSTALLPPDGANLVCTDCHTAHGHKWPGFRRPDVVSCDSCHAKDGRLDAVPGFYMPGRDGFAMTDRIGLGLLALSLGGVGIHAGIRIVMSRRRRDGKG